jgi:hypothetical protein
MLSQEQREANEYQRWETIDKAISAAERILLKETDGSDETLLWLTMEMARRYQEKAMIMVSAALHKKELLGDGRNSG